MGLRMQPRHETFVTLFGKTGSNIVESVAILMAFGAVPERASLSHLLTAENRAVVVFKNPPSDSAVLEHAAEALGQFVS